MKRTPAPPPTPVYAFAHARGALLTLGTLLLFLLPALVSAAQAQPQGQTLLEGAAWGPQLFEGIDTAVRRSATEADARTGAAPGVRHRVEVEVGRLDPRLRLAPCQQVQVHLPPGVRLWGRSRIGLRCLQGEVKWNVFLPVTVKVWGPGLVLARPVEPGVALKAADVRVAEVDLAADASPALLKPTDVEGRALARLVTEGSGLRRDDLKVRRWFETGDLVSLQVRGPGFAVDAQATAMAPGDEGRCARLRMDTGRVVCAHPAGDRRAELSL